MTDHAAAYRRSDDDHICPECKAGKHPNCTGDAWCFSHDEPTPCRCPDRHHLPLEPP